MRMHMHRRRACLCLLAFALGCGGRPAPTATTAEPTKAKSAQSGKSAASDGANALMPKPAWGWRHATPAQRKTIDAYAEDYRQFLGTHKTPRRAVNGLLRLAQNAGATELTEGTRPGNAAGKLLFLRARGGDAAAILRVGSRPIEEGARIVLVNVDAPRIDLKQNPVFTKAGLAMLDTAPYGSLDLPAWLAQPLALYVHVARPGAADGPIDLAIGDNPNDPVLSIPDLLPHLSRGGQPRGIVDSPERMNAVAATSREALAAFLRTHGVDESMFATAEATLVPAGPAVFIGTDRALLAGYGHRHRSAAYAAVRALLEVESVPQTSIVIIASRDQDGWDSNSGLAFARTTLSAAMRALASDGTDLDVLGVRRIYRLTATLVASDIVGTRNRGVALSPRSDDALPRALRRVMDAFRAGGVQWHVAGDTARGQARTLGTLDMDAVDFAIPSTGRGTPYELASTLDLYQGYLACRAWFEHSR